MAGTDFSPQKLILLTPFYIIGIFVFILRSAFEIYMLNNLFESRF